MDLFKYKKNVASMMAYGLLLATTSALASPWNGAYVTLSGGMSAFQSQINTETTLSHYVGLLKNEHQAHRQLPMASIGLGYGRLFHCHWYLGSELGYERFFSGQGLSSSTQTHVGGIIPFDCSTTDTINLNQSFSWSALLGYQWRRYLSYVRLGYVNTLVNYNNDFILIRSFSDPSSFNSHHHLSLNGIRLGLGVKALISKHVSVGAEINYTQYANRHLALGLNTDSFNVSTQTNAALTGLKTINTMVSLSYHF